MNTYREASRLILIYAEEAADRFKYVENSGSLYRKLSECVREQDRACRGMDLGAENSKLALMSLPLWAGVQLNIYNLLLTLLHLWQNRRALAVNAIICSISSSNVLLSLSCFLLIYLVNGKAIITSSGQTNPLYCIGLFLWLSSCGVSFWSIAWLNVFYCVKVVSLSMECLRTLKRNISSVTCAALILTNVGSFLLFSPFLSLRMVPLQLNPTYGTNGSIVRNASHTLLLEFAPWIDSTFYVATFICLLCPLPLMVMLPTALRLVVHLCQHTLSLRRNQTQCQGSASYLQVCKLTVSLVGVYLTSLFIVSIYLISRLDETDLGYEMAMLACTFYSVSTAALLTASSRHLKDRLHCRSCWRDSDPANSRQTTETVST